MKFQILSLVAIIGLSAFAHASNVRTVNIDCRSLYLSDDKMYIELKGSETLDRGKLTFIRARPRKNEQKVLSFTGDIVANWREKNKVRLLESAEIKDYREAYQVSLHYVDIPKYLTTSKSLNRRFFDVKLMRDDVDTGKTFLEFLTCKVRK